MRSEQGLTHRLQDLPRNREKILNSHGKLVGGFNPSEKYQSKWESSLGRGENRKYLKPPPSKSHGKDPKVTEMMPFGIAIKYQISTKSIRNGSTSQNIKMVRCVACLTLLQTCFWHTTCSYIVVPPQVIQAFLHFESGKIQVLHYSWFRMIHVSGCVWIIYFHSKPASEGRFWEDFCTQPPSVFWSQYILWCRP